MVPTDMTRPWYHWILIPLMLLMGIGLPFIVQPPTPSGYIVIGWLSVTLLLGVVGLLDPARNRWAFKSAAVSILVAYSSYAIWTTISWLRGGATFFPDATGQPSVLQSLLVLTIFGAPALRFLSREERRAEAQAPNPQP